MARTLEDIVYALKLGKNRNTGCTLLLGAGCSKTAGIPLAGGIVSHIRNDTYYNQVYMRALDRARKSNVYAAEPSYGDCMAEMDPGDQRELIRSYIDAASLNWAHAGIAALIKYGYVGRVLTTNFDPLVARACAVFNELPAVYDLTMSEIRNYKELPDKAIFHLHGQRYGFSMLNDPKELNKHRRLVKPLFEHAREMRAWIVCGYSGENDPLFELIKSCDSYDHALYWIGREAEPPAHLQSLLSGKKTQGCHYLQFAGADEFFLRLCGSLGIADFPFMHRPLEHIEELLGHFVPYPTAATERGIDLLQMAKVSVKKYKDLLMNVSASEAADQKIAETLATEGLHAALASLSDNADLITIISPSMRAWLNLVEGYEISKQAGDVEDPGQAFALLQQSTEKFSAAVAIQPTMEEALYNWGNSLAAQAKISPGKDSRRLLEDAGKKYAAAVAIDSNSHMALNNWGNVLSAQARYSPYEEALVLWADAAEKYIAALAVKGDKHETFYNWGNAIASQAGRCEDDDAKALWAEAGEKYASALMIKPNSCEALSNWGNALSKEAQCSPDDVAHKLWAEAGEKFAAAFAIKPDMPKVLAGWAEALDAQARRSSDDQACRLWSEARQKYAAVLAIKPDEHGVLINWSGSLILAAHRNDGVERKRLLAEAYEKASRAETLMPGHGAYNLACIHAMRGELGEMVEWLDRSLAAGKLPDRKHIAADRDFDSVRETMDFKAWLLEMGWIN